MYKDQRIRAFLFYLSVIIFLTGLPLLLSSALSYKFNPHTLKFSKASLIAIKTQPQGASVYLNDKLLNEKSPTTINELLPGRYRVLLELDSYYPWAQDVNVEAGKVLRLEKIILFPLRPDIKQLNKERISSFWFDKEKAKMYYLNEEEKIIYKSDLEGDNFEAVGVLPEKFLQPTECKVSPDREKLLCLNQHQIAMVYLGPQDNSGNIPAPFVLEYAEQKIIDAFWHSDSFHIILVTSRNIEALEAKLDSKAVILANLNKKNTSLYYDQDKDTLYFLDSEKALDGKFYDNVYKLELNTRSPPFKELIKPKTNEQQ